ncbi:MAG: S8 family serine peptidase [Verrucomicrobia bacterium]|nr:S8 family serine peptidase [Verrucomicrobiota bacterium]
MDLFGFYPLAPPRNAMGALSAFSTAPFNPSRILIKPKPGVALGRLSPLQASLRGHVSREFPAMQNLRVVQLPAGSDVRSAIRNFQASGLVAYAEPDYLVHALAEPNDPRFQDGTLWNFRNTGQSGGVAGADIRATEGWDARATAENVIVAVVDTGIRYTHEDLALNLWKNPGEIPGNGLDDDGNGYVDDVHGINALRNDGDPMDDHGHGSHVSGIIGAVANNQIGVAGVAWKVRLMACKFINAQGDGAVSDAITCIDYARKHGAHIINGLQRRRRFHRDPHCRGR